MDFVIHHMLQPLIVCGTEEDLRIHSSTSVSIVHNLKTPSLIPAAVKHPAQVVNLEGGKNIIVRDGKGRVNRNTLAGFTYCDICKWCSIPLLTHKSSHFAHEALN